MGVARWDGNRWQAIPGIGNGTANLMREYLGELYILGDFEQPGHRFYGIIKWDGNQVTGISSPISNIRDLEVYNNQLYATGYADGSEYLAVFMVKSGI